MRRSYLSITIVTVLLLGVAATGYLLPEKGQKLPVRILFENNGGRVIFNHLVHHKDFQLACASCHHEGPEYQGEDEPLPCGSCHPKDFDEAFVTEHVNSFPDKTYCVNCHHAEFGELAFDHDAHIDYAADDCQACHHDENIDPDTVGCGQCHGQVSEGNKPSVREAAHQRCSTCHEDMFEQGIKGCGPCHNSKDMSNYKGSFTPCSQCHHSPEPNRELVLTRTNAFHDKCMNCHEELKK
ncbi:MAG: cytochrome C, partial [Proteobacteria bacterium]|nr:cytochrome C [Pseudomonadota bacterium]